MMSVGRYGTLTVVTAVGEFDMANSGELRGHLQDAMSQGTGRVVLDLSLVTFLDCSSLGVLVEAREQLAACGGTLTLVGAPAPIEMIFQLTGLSGAFALRRSLRDVLAEE